MRLVTLESGQTRPPESRINGTTMIPDLLRTTPQARSVLDRYGLRGCGGPTGPMESLEFFARAHDVPLPKLLDELEDVVRQPDRSPVADADDAVPEVRREDVIYRPFFKSGIAVVLTLGAAWGVYLLLRIALTGRFAAAGFHEVNAHGHAQIFGWVGLFVMGFAYQAFPRFKHTSLAWPRIAFATLGMMLVGVVVRSLAQPLATTLPAAWWAAVGASVLEVTAITLFAANIVTTWRRSGKPLAFYDGYILAALGWFVVQAVYEGVYLTATLSATGMERIHLAATWQIPLRDVQIHGFALMMILGVSQRIFHHFYGLPQPNPRLSRSLLVILNLAVVGEVAGLILKRLSGPAWAGLWYGSVIVLAASVVILVWNWRIYSTPQDHDRSLKFLRTAYGWLLLSLAMLVLLPAYQHGVLPWFAPASEASRIGFSHAYYGAIRHAITVGFISLMIVGVAAKVVPTLNGIPSRRLTALWGPFVLINTGCALRVTGQTLTDFTAAAFPIAGVSGLLELAGLALWGGHLWLVMSGRPRLRAASPTVTTSPTEALKENEPIRAAHTVGTVLDVHPQLLDVFTAHGFTMLANPQLRRTIARVVTIEQACRRTGVDVAAFLQMLNDRRGDQQQRSDQQEDQQNEQQRDRHCCPTCANEPSPIERE